MNYTDLTPYLDYQRQQCAGVPVLTQYCDQQLLQLYLNECSLSSPTDTVETPIWNQLIVSRLAYGGWLSDAHIVQGITYWFEREGPYTGESVDRYLREIAGMVFQDTPTLTTYVPSKPTRRVSSSSPPIRASTPPLKRSSSQPYTDTPSPSIDPVTAVLAAQYLYSDPSPSSRCDTHHTSSHDSGSYDSGSCDSGSSSSFD